jgi:hypothetical protein
MLPQDQLIFGIASGLTAWMLLRWTPLWRDLIAATTAAGLIHFVANEKAPRGQGVASLAAKLPAGILNYPHFSLGLALAVVGVMAILYFARER